MNRPPPSPDGLPAPGEEDPAARLARLTALALGELSPRDAGAMEAEIWRDVDARREVERTQALAESLTFAFSAEPSATLTAGQRRAILERSNMLTGSDEKEARLTAYALGELRPSQAEVLSARLRDDRAATLELETVGELAATLRAAFADEPIELLTPAQRQAVLDHGARRSAETTAPSASALRPVPRRPARPPAGRTLTQPTPTPAPARRWLRTAALAAGFATFGYVVSTQQQSPIASAPVSPVDEVPAAHEHDFFPVRPSTANPGAPQLLALLDQEKRRPSAAAAVDASGIMEAQKNPSAETERSTTSDASDPATTELAATPAAPSSLGPAPRRQPDASVLPPPRKTVASATGARSAPDSSTVLHSPLAAPGSLPLAGFLATADVAAAALPTDLGRAGYDVVRQCIRDFGTLPPADLVRPEEIINQFDYDVHPAPGQDFAVAIEAAACPWNETHQLVRVTVAARAAESVTPPLRLTVFLRLAETAENERAQLLAWQGLQALAGRLRPEDSVSLVVWGRARGLVMPRTSVAELENLRDAPTRWHQGGAILGQTDWATAEQALFRQATDNSRNLCLVVTDGPLDFSGLTLAEAAQRLRSLGTEIAVAELGPLRPESRTAQLADLAAAPYFRVDSGPEAARLLARDVFASRAPVAEDVDIQVAFNANALAAWRPIGFSAPAGGAPSLTTGTRAPWTAGRQVTALYEVVPAVRPGSWPHTAIFASPASSGAAAPATAAEASPPLSVRLRYRQPRASSVQVVTTDWTASASAWRAASPEFRLAAGAAAFALRLQDDHAVHGLPLARLSEWVRLAAATRDDFGLRREFASMLDAVERLEIPE